MKTVLEQWRYGTILKKVISYKISENTMVKTLLFITALCITLNACNKQDKQNEYSEYDDDYDQQEVI